MTSTSQETGDLHIASTVPLASPAQLAAELPTTDVHRASVSRGRAQIEAVLRQDDPRLMVVVGPCSIHDERSTMEYAERLARLSEQVQDHLLVVMRVYFEKPRTTVGWKGLVYDPNLDGTFDINDGLRRARKLLLDVTAMGLPAGTEFLDPIVPQYLADLVSWTAIGARTTESQTHRQMASGLSMPVGFKNRTDGNSQVAVDAMVAARAPHAFLGIDRDGRTCVINTTGNPYGHLVLRGGTGQTNFDSASVAGALEELRASGSRPLVMVDCSHANSAKDHTRQSVAFRDVIEQRRAGSDGVVGLMLESHLFAGNQPIDGGELRYGVSVTDACIDWNETETLLNEAAEALAAAPAAPAAV
ncbi:MAG: 3-deoxy-7-phosphoheptulonate synthase [Chloroflexi bacterium]|nr:3-deoxy-7-phosphoheptulonate synthase [Chloroflexota bacterium]MDA1146305.1 3-deoxy-7-phosphoheptulonate synthase [Chloroflexota bacterium]